MANASRSSFRLEKKSPTTTPMMARNVDTRSSGRVASRMMILEPADESVQKRSVAFGPMVLEAGTLRLEVRQFSIASIGSNHFVPSVGPFGPLNSHPAHCPHRPPKRAQAKGPLGSGSFGTTTAFNGVRTAGSVVLSHPNPVPPSPQPM